MITFNIPTLQLLVLIGGTVLPLLVGLVTTKSTNPGTRAVLLALLAMASQLLAEVIKALETGTPYNLGMGLLLGLVTFLVAVGTHYGLLKPTGASSAAISAGSGRRAKRD